MQNRELHSRLASVLVDNLLDATSDASTLRLWQAKGESFPSNCSIICTIAYRPFSPLIRYQPRRLILPSILRLDHA